MGEYAVILLWIMMRYGSVIHWMVTDKICEDVIHKTAHYPIKWICAF